MAIPSRRVSTHEQHGLHKGEDRGGTEFIEGHALAGESDGWSV